MLMAIEIGDVILGCKVVKLTGDNFLSGDLLAKQLPIADFLPK